MVDTPKAFAKLLQSRLDRLAENRQAITLWLRDDDAIAPTARLDRLLGLVERFDIPIGLAVIPAEVTDALAPAIAGVSKIAVLQHGWAHRNHQPPGEKKSELGDGRPTSVVTGELVLGRSRLIEMFDSQFSAVLVPPWNRICRAVSMQRSKVFLPGLSTFSAADPEDPCQVNTHIDPIAWRTTRGFVGWSEIHQSLKDQIDARCESNSSEPIGILTHHLDHDGGCWEFVEILLQVAARHEAVRWPNIKDLFGLESG